MIFQMVIKISKEIQAFNDPDCISKFRLYQTERVCRRHFELHGNGRKFPKQSVENTVGKNDKLLVTSNLSFFPTVFPKDFVMQLQKKQGLFGKWLIVCAI